VGSASVAADLTERWEVPSDHFVHRLLVFTAQDDRIRSCEVFEHDQEQVDRLLG
jgi:hypothetical protein